jgi:hypothetical protein
MYANDDTYFSGGSATFSMFSLPTTVYPVVTSITNTTTTLGSYPTIMIGNNEPIKNDSYILTTGSSINFLSDPSGVYSVGNTIYTLGTVGDEAQFTGHDTLGNKANLRYSNDKWYMPDSGLVLGDYATTTEKLLVRGGTSKFNNSANTNKVEIDSSVATPLMKLTTATGSGSALSIDHTANGNAAAIINNSSGLALEITNANVGTYSQVLNVNQDSSGNADIAATFYNAGIGVYFTPATKFAFYSSSGLTKFASKVMGSDTVTSVATSTHTMVANTMLTNAFYNYTGTGGAFTTPTASQMYSAMSGTENSSFEFTIVNNSSAGNAGMATLTGDTGVTIYNSNGSKIPYNSSKTFLWVQTSSTAATIYNLSSTGDVNTVALTSPIETFATRAAMTGTVNYDVSTQAVLYANANATANWTLNVRGSSGVSLNTLLATNQAITIVLINQNGTTAYYQTAMQIDGTSVTPKWSGGTAPTSGNASSNDVYTFTIMKTASATYTVLASVTKWGA